MKWFYYNDKWKRVGPFSDDEFKQLAQTGVILPSTPVENEDGRRAAAERVAGLFASKAAPTQSWETRFQKLTETVVEGGNVVDGKMNDFSKRLDGLALTTGELTRRLTALETSSREARDALSERANAAEKRLDAKDAEWAKRADSVEKRVGDKTGELTRRIDEFERRWSAGRAETTKRVGDLDARIVGVVNLSRRVDVLENKSGDLAKRFESLETSVGGARLGVSRRLDAVEKTVDGTRAGLTKRVGELENRADASGVWTKRLDALARRLETNGAEIAKRLTTLEERGDATSNASESTRRLNGLERRLDENVADWGERLRVVEKKVGERSPELETSRAFEGLVEKLNGLGEALAAFDARFERLAERLDALERRFDEEAKRNGGQSDEARRSEPENRDDKTTRPAFRPFGAPERESALGDVENDKDDVDLEEESLKLDFWSDDDGERNEENAVGDESATTARRWEPGKYRVGDDWPPGRYQAEIRRGWASIELELADDYRCYVLETDPNVDGYAPRCVLEAPEGAIATLDNPVELTYLGALR